MTTGATLVVAPVGQGQALPWSAWQKSRAAGEKGRDEITIQAD